MASQGTPKTPMAKRLARIFGATILSVCTAVLAVALIVALFVNIIERTPYGSSNMMQKRAEVIRESYENGNYSEAVRLYQTEVDLPLSPDMTLSKYGNPISEHTKLDRPFHLMMGDSYRELGHSSIAEEHYLRALGWDRDQYRAYCALHNDCHDLSTIARR